MPPMQISRLSQQNRGSPNGDGGSSTGNGSIELLENGIDDIELSKNGDTTTESTSHSVSFFVCCQIVQLCFTNRKCMFFRMHYWIYLVVPI